MMIDMLYKLAIVVVLFTLSYCLCKYAWICIVCLINRFTDKWRIDD